MSALNDCHDQAMEYAAFALMAREQGDTSRAMALFEQALQLELAAIAELPEPIEPTHSVLHRSAGWMAFHCRQYRKAEQLVANALAEEPPGEIAAELRELLDAVYAEWRPQPKIETAAD